MGNLLRFVVDYRACLAPSVPFALLGRCPPLGHAYPHLLAVRLCLQVARPVRIPEIHPGIRFYLCGRLPRFRCLLSGGNGQTARHSFLHPPHSGLPSRLRTFFQPEKTLGVVHPTGLQPSARRMESHGIHPHFGSRCRGYERMVPPLRTPYRQDAARTGTAGLEGHESHRLPLRPDLRHGGGLLRHFADGRRKRRAQSTHRHVTSDKPPHLPA